MDEIASSLRPYTTSNLSQLQLHEQQRNAALRAALPARGCLGGIGDTGHQSLQVSWHNVEVEASRCLETTAVTATLLGLPNSAFPWQFFVSSLSTWLPCGRNLKKCKCFCFHSNTPILMERELFASVECSDLYVHASIHFRGFTNMEFLIPHSPAQAWH